MTLWILALVSTLLLGNQKLPDGDALINKALARYDYVKTVTATVAVALPGRGSPVTGETEAIILSAQVVNNGKGQMARSRIGFAAPTDISPEARTGQGNWVLLDDGKRFYTLYPALKQFTSATRNQDRFSALFRPTIERMRARGVKFRTGEIKREGKLLYLIQGKSIDGFTAQVVLEKSTLMIQNIIISSPTGRVVNQITLSNQRYDAPIPTDTFVRPADYQPLEP